MASLMEMLKSKTKKCLPILRWLHIAVRHTDDGCMFTLEPVQMLVLLCLLSHKTICSFEKVVEWLKTYICEDFFGNIHFEVKKTVAFGMMPVICAVLQLKEWTDFYKSWYLGIF